MPRLRPPTLDVYSSFVQAMAEFYPVWRGRPFGDSLVEVNVQSGDWGSADTFAAYVERLRTEADPVAARRNGRVACTTWWWCEGDTYLGRVAVRHRLNKHLLEVGGHIGYSIRPTARRRGHATAMLAAVLPLVHDLGVDPALVTCDVDNVASRRVIEHNGGVLEDRRQDKLRFWIPTSRPASREREHQSPSTRSEPAV